MGKETILYGREKEWENGEGRGERSMEKIDISRIVSSEEV